MVWQRRGSPDSKKTRAFLFFKYFLTKFDFDVF